MHEFIVFDLFFIATSASIVIITALLSLLIIRVYTIVRETGKNTLSSS